MPKTQNIKHNKSIIKRNVNDWKYNNETNYRQNKAYLFSRDDGSIGDKWEVDSWIRNQVSLEFIQIHI